MHFKKNRLLVLVLMIMSLTGICATASDVLFTGSCGDNVTYTIDSDGLLTFSGNGATKNYEHIGDTPWYDNRKLVKKAVIGKGVTSLGDNLLSDMQNVTEIILPSSVKSISDFAINYCDSLQKIQVDGSNRYFCNDAYGVLYSKNEKTLVHYPDGLALDSYTVPSSVTEIGSNAFLNSLNLKKISVAGNNTAFSSDSDGILYNKNKTALIVCPTGSETTDVAIPSTVESVNPYAFRNCNVKSVTMGNAVTYLGDRCFEHCNKLRSIKFSSGLRAIESYTFHGCYLLSEIVIPEGVEAIEFGAFYLCSNIRFITFPSTLKSIGGNAFYLCSKVAVIQNNSDLSVSIGCIKMIDKNGNVSLKKNHEIDENGFVFVKNGSSYLLRNYIGTEETVTLPSTYKGQSVKLDKFTGVKHIIIPEDITWLDSYAIDCEVVETVTLPDSDIHLDYYAIDSTYSLREIHLGAKTYLDSRALLNCKSLEKITVSEDSKYYATDENGVLYNKSKKMLVFCPPAIPLSEVTVLSGVTVIYQGAFEGCRVKTVILPDTLEAIYNEAFENSQITSIKIPASVNEIRPGAFGNCTSLTEITADEDSKYFCSVDGVLYSKDMTALVAYPSGATRKEFTVPDGVTTIERNAFYAWKNLRKITLPSTVTTLKQRAFFLGKFDTVILSEGITSIPDAAFYMCNGLGKIHIPDSVTFISASAFYMSEPYTFVCVKKSYAISYAKNYDVPFVVIGGGDVNSDGVIDLKDVTHLRRALAGGYGITVDQDSADVNCDDTADLKDVTHLRRALAGGYGIELY